MNHAIKQRVGAWSVRLIAPTRLQCRKRNDPSHLDMCCHLAAISGADGAADQGSTGLTMARLGSRMHPGRVLREEYMEPMRLDADGLAQALSVAPGRITPVIADEAPLTSDLALRLARFFGTSPQFWLGLQSAYDLSVAQARYGAEIEARVQPLAA